MYIRNSITKIICPQILIQTQSFLTHVVYCQDVYRTVRIIDWCFSPFLPSCTIHVGEAVAIK